MKKIRAAIIGAGIRGCWSILEEFICRRDDIECVGIADPKEAAKELARKKIEENKINPAPPIYDDYKKMIDELAEKKLKSRMTKIRKCNRNDK